MWGSGKGASGIYISSGSKSSSSEAVRTQRKIRAPKVHQTRGIWGHKTLENISNLGVLKCHFLHITQDVFQ